MNTCPLNTCLVDIVTYTMESVYVAYQVVSPANKGIKPCEGSALRNTATTIPSTFQGWRPLKVNVPPGQFLKVFAWPLNSNKNSCPTVAITVDPQNIGYPAYGVVTSYAPKNWTMATTTRAGGNDPNFFKYLEVMVREKPSSRQLVEKFGVSVNQSNGVQIALVVLVAVIVLLLLVMIFWGKKWGR